MQRWALVRGEEVREYLLAESKPTPEEFNRRAWGDESPVREDGSRVEDEGAWIRVPAGAGLVTTGWRHVDGGFLPPVTA